jgi:hypothetical protein
MPEAEWIQVLWGSMSMGAKEGESSTGHIWAAGFHHVMARSHLAHILKLITVYFFNFQIFFLAAVNPRYRINGYKAHLYLDTVLMVIKLKCICFVGHEALTVVTINR